MKTIYHLSIANQTYSAEYELLRETKMYVFLRQITKNPPHIFRVHKKTLSVKGIKEGKLGYKFDAPKARILIKIK